MCFVLADSNLIKSLHNCFCAFIFNFLPNSIGKKKVVNEQNLITSRMCRRKSFLKSCNHRENFTLKLILKKKIIVDLMNNVNASFSIYLYTTELRRYISTVRQFA